MTQEKFYFGEAVIDKVIEEIKKAKSYIKIVVFQIHNIKLINELLKKQKEGVLVELITLPQESIHGDSEPIWNKLKKLDDYGGKLLVFNWNVGTTEITKTVSTLWYGLHAKFIVTDKSAIALSANLTEEPQVDAILVSYNKESIKEFNNKFELIKEYYINEKIVKKIEEKVSDKKVFKSIFTPPEHIQKYVTPCNNYPKINRSILHYPDKLCPDTVKIEEGLYVLPFDCKGRNFLMQIIEDAKEFVYISSERFTDEDFFIFLERIGGFNKNIDIKIIAKFRSQDYQYKINKLVKDLICFGIILKDLKDAHAKLVITDRLLAIGSLNLNKMNLGFESEDGFWRANTEVMFVCKNPQIIKEAKKTFLDSFEKESENIVDKLASKESTDFNNIVKYVLGTKQFKAAYYLAEKYIEEEFKLRKKYIKIIFEADKLRKKAKENRITEELVKKAEKNLS